jgi:hypothetical protein
MILRSRLRLALVEHEFPPHAPEITDEPDDAGTFPRPSIPSYSNDFASLPRPHRRFRFW